MYPTRILLVTDGSPDSWTAVETAVGLAAGTSSELHVAHAISTVPPMPCPSAFGKEADETVLGRLRLAALALLDEKVGQVEKLGCAVAGSHYREGVRPADEVLLLAEKIGAGLIVTASRSLRDPGRPFAARNFASEIYRRADCPVIVVRTQDTEQAPGS